MTITRRQRREWAIQLLSGADLNPPGDTAGFLDDFWNTLSTLDPSEGGAVVPPKERAFTEERFLGVLAEREAIDQELQKLLDNWEIDRLGTVERAVLRMGMWEIKRTDTPAAVVVNEAIDLVNWFSAPRSRALVNGVLDKYAKNTGRSAKK